MKILSTLLISLHYYRVILSREINLEISFIVNHAKSKNNLQVCIRKKVKNTQKGFY